MDIFLFRLINNLANRFSVLDALGVFASSGLIWLMMLALLVVFALRGRVREQRHELATVAIVFIATVGAYVTNVLISLIHFRPRPFVTLADVHLLIAKSAEEKSFPSDHATLAFVIGASVFFAHRKLGIVFLIAAICVAVGRVFVGVHYPSDILAGAIIGSAWVWLVSSVGRGSIEKFLKGHYEHRTA